jgi:signal transduction histidine kinase
MKPTAIHGIAYWVRQKFSDFVFPVPMDAEEKAKRFLTALIALLTLPLLLGYAIFNLYVHSFNLAGALFLTTFLIVAAILLGRKKADARNTYRIGLVMVGLLLLYLVFTGETHPRRLFWSFIFPLEAFYLLGKKEGFLFSVSFNVIAVIIVSSHNFGPLALGHDTRFKVEYALSMFTVTLFAYCFELMRFRYQETTRERQGSLETANIRLEEEIVRRKIQERAARDALSQLKETQTQLVQSAKLASMGELVSGVAHELNQPLMVIRANAQLLERWLKQASNTSSEPLESLALVEANTKRMMTIINHLRTFSRDAKEDFTALDVNKAVEACRLMMGEQLRLRDIQLQLDLAENLPMIRGNEIQMEQVFLNLLTNARDAIEDQKEGSLKVRMINITTAVLEDGGDKIEILVKDTGKGISGENLDRIFEPFFTTKEIGKGTGLGLSISYGIIKDHNGEIKVAETGSDGTVFQIHLPLWQREASARKRQ